MTTKLASWQLLYGWSALRSYISRWTDLRARYLPLARSKLGLCSANHRADYFSNLACDWRSIVWAYSEHDTENGPTHIVIIVYPYWNRVLFTTIEKTHPPIVWSQGWLVRILMVYDAPTRIQYVEKSIINISRQSLWIMIFCQCFKSTAWVRWLKAWIFIARVSAMIVMDDNGSSCRNRIKYCWVSNDIEIFLKEKKLHSIDSINCKWALYNFIFFIFYSMALRIYHKDRYFTLMN